MKQVWSVTLLLMSSCSASPPSDRPAHVDGLASPIREEWTAVACNMISQERPDVAGLMRAAASSHELLAFRARQLLDVIQSNPVGGVRVGLILESPKLHLHQAIAGIECIINHSGHDIQIWPMLRVTLTGPMIPTCDHWGPISPRIGEQITVADGTALGRWQDFLWTSPPGHCHPSRPGLWELRPSLNEEPAGNSVTVEFTE
jgi:hypothetical protein